MCPAEQNLKAFIPGNAVKLCQRGLGTSHSPETSKTTDAVRLCSGDAKGLPKAPILAITTFLVQHNLMLEDEELYWTVKRVLVMQWSMLECFPSQYALASW